MAFCLFVKNMSDKWLDYRINIKFLVKLGVEERTLTFTKCNRKSVKR